MQGISITIPSIIKVGNGMLDEVGPYLKEEGLDKVAILLGNGLIDLFGKRVIDSMNKAGIEVLSYQELDDVNIEEMTKLAFALSNNVKAVLGIGGGKVIDSAKYVGYMRQIPFISIPTSSSSDGFSSASASLYVDGRKTTVPASMAYGIIVDTEVIKTAPERFIYSGIGDMVAKITAIYDWVFEASKGYGKVNDMALMVAKMAVNSFVRTPFTDIHDDVFLRELINALAMSGIANEIAGGSAPTSGSEHLISHALDKYAKVPQLHGVQVGIATLLMAKVQEHRVERIQKVFEDTGFWDYCCSLNLDIDDYKMAIEKAPSIKPHRHTYLHEEEYRIKAIEILDNDDMFKRLFAEKTC